MMEPSKLATKATAVLAEVDEAMWLRAREGDVAAAKLVYARLAQILPPPAPALPPTWAEVQALMQQIQQQQEELAHGVLDNVAELGTRPAG